MQKNLSYFKTKINVTKVGTEKEDEKMGSGFHNSLDFFLNFFDKCLGSIYYLSIIYTP